MILVTGAAGFIGSHLVDRLLAHGHAVVGLDNFDPFYDPEAKRRNLSGAHATGRFRLLEADCAHLPAVEQGLAGLEIEAIVHLAAKAGVRPSIQEPMAYTRSNVDGTVAMLELARLRGIKRFVFASSSSVYGNNPSVPFRETDAVDEPISPYAATKRSGELLCKTWQELFGLSIVCLRFFTVYGPRQRPDLAIRKFATLMLRGEPIPMYGDGSTERDYTWIDDIIAGVVAAIDYTAAHPRAFEIVNLGESRTTSLRRLIELIGQALQVEPAIQRLPPQPGDVARTFADVSRAHKLLRYEPTTPVETGIPRFIEWLTSDPQRWQAPARTSAPAAL